MFKNAVVIFAVIASVAGKPHLIGAPVALPAPAAVVTATSSQVIARNYNGIATAPIVAPVAAPVIAKTVAPVAFTAPAAAPVVTNAVTPIAFSAPVVAKTVAPLPFAAPIASYAAAYSTPLAYSAAPSAFSAPLHYAAAPVPALW